MLSRPRKPPENTLFHPPGEVQRQLLEAELEEGNVPTLAQLFFVAVHGPDRPRVYRRVDVVKVPLVGRHLAVGMEVMVAEEQPQLLLGEVNVHQRQGNGVKGRVPDGIPGVLPLDCITMPTPSTRVNFGCLTTTGSGGRSRT